MVYHPFPRALALWLVSTTATLGAELSASNLTLSAHSVETVTVLVPDASVADPTNVNCADEGAPCVEADVDVTVDVLRERTWQRLAFLGVGVVMGKNAAIGFGPRALFRTGWYNTPHAVDLTGHLGWSAQAPFSKKANGRVRPLVDLNLFGGAMVPFRDSIPFPAPMLMNLHAVVPYERTPSKPHRGVVRIHRRSGVDIEADPAALEGRALELRFAHRFFGRGDHVDELRRIGEKRFRRRTAPHNAHALDDVALSDAVHDVHALDNVAEHDVVAVEIGAIAQGQGGKAQL